MIYAGALSLYRTSMQAIRKMVRRGLSRVGLERIRYPSLVELIVHERFDTVIDVGANEGQYASDLRDGGFRGRIVSFEPIGEVFATLSQRSSIDDKWECHRLALGARSGVEQINVAAATVYSSFKDRSEFTKSRFKGASPVRTETIEVVRLDQFIQSRPRDFDNCLLKVDTQGFEKEVLQGAGDALGLFRGIQLELPLKPLYVEQEDWMTTVHWMLERGYKIAMLKENGWGWSDMRLHEVDALFLRD